MCDVTFPPQILGNYCYVTVQDCRRRFAFVFWGLGWRLEISRRRMATHYYLCSIEVTKNLYYWNILSVAIAYHSRLSSTTARPTGLWTVRSDTQPIALHLDRFVRSQGQHWPVCCKPWAFVDRFACNLVPRALSPLSLAPALAPRERR